MRTMSFTETWIEATKPRIVSLKISSIIAEAAPSEMRKFKTDLPEISEKMKMNPMAHKKIIIT